MTTMPIVTPTVTLIKTPKHQLFNVGDKLIYYHYWAKWEAPKDQHWFTWLKPVDIEQLAPGDQVWMDVDPLYHHGKVYGCVLIEITAIEGTAETGMRVSFDGGFTTISPTTSSKFAVLTDEQQVYLWSSVHRNARHV